MKVVYDYTITKYSDIKGIPWGKPHLVEMIQFIVDLIITVFSSVHIKCASDNPGFVEIYNVDSRDIEEIKVALKWNNTRWYKKYIRCATPKTRGRNKGEIGEQKIIHYLFANRNDVVVINQMFGINSRISLHDPIHDNVLSEDDITCWKSTAKADFTINFIDAGITKHPSIKCFDGSPPTLLNHTRRSAKYFQETCGRLSTLDAVIKQMNAIRGTGECGEDIPYSKLTLSDEEFICLSEVIRYFTFQGTGTKESRRPADSVLVVDNTGDIPNTSQFYDCGTVEKQEEYVHELLPKLRFCMRSGKGMLPKSSKDYISDMKLCEPWIFHNGDKLCGALHIRYNI